MAIIDVTDIAFRSFSGYEDPRYPSGFWRAEGQVLGNATGGDMSVQIDFAKSSSLQNSEFYSLEEISLFQPTATGHTVGMLIANLDAGSAVGARRYSLILIANQAGTNGLDPASRLGILGLYLGRQSAPASATSLTFGLDNNDGISFNVVIGGYIWSARSANVSGGPQRPPTGLYPN